VPGVDRVRRRGGQANRAFRDQYGTQKCSAIRPDTKITIKEMEENERRSKRTEGETEQPKEQEMNRMSRSSPTSRMSRSQEQ